MSINWNDMFPKEEEHNHPEGHQHHHRVPRSFTKKVLTNAKRRQIRKRQNAARKITQAFFRKRNGR